MYRIDNDTASTTLPTPKPVGTPGFFTTGTIGGQAATIAEADWFNEVQEELINVVTRAGITPAKLDNTQVITAILSLIANNTRQRLTGPLTLYVSNSGSDSNNGLTPSTAFATCQAAWNYIMTRLDVGGQTVTVQMADGTYAPFSADGAPVGAESQEVIFSGDVANPGLVTITQPGNANAVEVYGAARIKLQGVTLQSNLNCIYAMGGGSIYVANVTFNACGGTHMLCDQHSLIEIVGPYTIAGGATSHMWAVKGGHMGSGLSSTPFVVTLIGTPDFTGAFCTTQGTGTSDHNYETIMSYNGAATGKRFQVDSCGVLICAHGNANYFPGSIAGTVDATTFGVRL